MADAVEVAVEGALLDRYNAFIYGSPDLLRRAQPNVAFTPPVAGPGVYWLRATFLPADSFALGVDFGSHSQHYGIFQVDVFWGQGSGELRPGRLAAEIISWFRRGTRMTRDGFAVDVIRTPYRSRMVKDDPWVMIPVSIPYLAFATSPT